MGADQLESFVRRPRTSSAAGCGLALEHAGLPGHRQEPLTALFVGDKSQVVPGELLEAQMVLPACGESCYEEPFQVPHQTQCSLGRGGWPPRLQTSIFPPHAVGEMAGVGTAPSRSFGHQGDLQALGVIVVAVARKREDALEQQYLAGMGHWAGLAQAVQAGG